MRTIRNRRPPGIPSTRPLSLVMAALFLAVLVGGATAGTVFHNPEFRYVVDIPVGWEVLEARQTDFVSFTDPGRVAVLQIISFPGERFATVETLDRFIRERFGASGDRSSFRYRGDHAIFADYTFQTGGGGSGGDTGSGGSDTGGRDTGGRDTGGRDTGSGAGVREPIRVRGYMTFLNGDEFDFAVMAYVVEEHYETYHDTLLSALDSFSVDRRHRMHPGPVSAFYMAPEVERIERGEYPADRVELVLPSGAAVALPPMVAAEGPREAAQVLIEREARLLTEYAPREGDALRFGDGPAPPWARAWRRYFRMVYRDSFARLEPVAEAVFDDLAREGVPRQEMPARILTWLQGARYRRTGALSDLMNPSWCLVEFAGDCDSLGLTYAIILQHLGFDAILMVSMEYAHAMVGVDVPGEGARFPFENRRWLVAELTEEVPIGLIAEDMSDIGGWLGIKLDPTMP